MRSLFACALVSVLAGLAAYRPLLLSPVAFTSPPAIFFLASPNAAESEGCVGRTGYGFFFFGFRASMFRPIILGIWVFFAVGRCRDVRRNLTRTGSDLTFDGLVFLGREDDFRHCHVSRTLVGVLMTPAVLSPSWLVFFSVVAKLTSL